MTTQKHYGHLRKLPTETREQENVKVQNNLKQASKLFGLQGNDMGTFAYLMDALQEVASLEQDYGKNSKQKSLEILVRTIADFLAEKSTKKRILK